MAYRRPMVTPNNKGPLIEFTAYLLLTTSVLTVLTKISTKLFVLKRVQSDDWFALSSLAFALGQYGAVFAQVKGGLGQHIRSLTPGQVESFQKARYAVELQYILSIALAKMITLRFLNVLAREKNNRRWLNVIIAANTIWAFVSFIVVAFQCSTPLVWDTISGMCLDQPALWSFISIADILIDLIISLLPVKLLYATQIPRMKKANTVIAFAGRILVIPVTVFRLANIYASNDSPDTTFEYFKVALTTEIATTFSILAACVSFVKPFMDTVETGLLASRVRNTTLGGQSQSYGNFSKLQYARSLFKPQEDVQEERDNSLTFPAGYAAGSREAYELTNKISAEHV